MRRHRLISKHNVPLTLLIAIMMRASVATGWMLETPSGNGFALPVLAICPQQSPTLAAWLDDGQPGHAHHQHTADAPPGEISLTVADPACALWAGSAQASANTIANAPGIAPPSTAPAAAVNPAPRRTSPATHRARAPPVLRSI